MICNGLFASDANRDDEAIAAALLKAFDLRPGEIIERLDLKKRARNSSPCEGDERGELHAANAATKEVAAGPQPRRSGASAAQTARPDEEQPGH
jgi:hypothetical protein